MKHRKLVATALLLLTLVGCSGRIKQGEVVKKTFEPAHTEVRMVPMVHSNGKTTYTTMRPYIYRYPDRWYIKIQQYDEEKNEMLTATYSVTEAVYDAVSIGAEFVYEEEMEPEGPEYTREKK